MNLLPFDDQPPNSTSGGPTHQAAQPEQATAAIPELLTIRDLARILKLSPRSIWRLVRNRQLPGPLRIGGSIRWRAEEIVKWIANGCERDSKTVGDSPEDVGSENEGVQP